MDDSIRAIRLCPGGETVENGKADSACDYCTAGICRELQACELPQTEVETKRAEWRRARIDAIQTPFD